MSFEQPIFWLGMAGFTPEQNKRLSLLLDRLPKGWPIWHSGAFAEADAWLVSGEKSRLLGADTLKVLAGLPTERTVQINLAEVDRPIAFSLPLASGDIDPMYSFDLSSDGSLHTVLRQFQVWLRHLCAQFVLGGQLIACQSQLLPGIYHVHHKGTLLAVMDFHAWRIGISPKAEPVDFELARWDRRPREARDIPGHFLHSSLAQLRWVYTQRTIRDMLPPRDRSQTVYFRRVPGVPVRWLKDSQLLLLRELSLEPGNFDTLRRRTWLTPAHLARDLASLYFAGSVTTRPEKASAAGFTGHEKGLSGDAQPSLSGASSLDPEAGPELWSYSPLAGDLTAPVRLGPE